MNPLSSFLFAQPNFWEGVARSVDFGGTLNEYNRSESADEADRRALTADWQSVAVDLKCAAISESARIVNDRRVSK